MNRYLKNLNKIEFIITYACTGKCKHCSEGEHTLCGEHIDSFYASRLIEEAVAKYDIKTVMTFGGEPLLYPDAVCDIHNTASRLGIEKRQIITNGYFSKSAEQINKVVTRLAECGVNDILLSVDAFHQETIPLDTVKAFAESVQKRELPIRLQPAWLVDKNDSNPYNIATRKILDEFIGMGIKENDGNIIFPEGNALKNLGEYFMSVKVENPYVENPADLRCLSVEPNGNLLDGNIYVKDVCKLLDNYAPYNKL